MNIIPMVGTDDITFGTTKSTIINLLGTPTEEQQLSDIEGYPKGRCLLNYVTRIFLVVPNNGLISITIELSDEPIILWDRDISNLCPIEFRAYMELMGEVVSIEKDGWGDCIVEALNCGVIAYFTDDKLGSIELHNTFVPKHVKLKN